ncbi:MAG TPA: hypothetical protein VHV28_07555 [Solirubrobacteraceae bacterium]|jgi:hypothetical protein|nr:hypothetical protein [Solirubrobacteraceae bacterium]
MPTPLRSAPRLKARVLAAVTLTVSIIAAAGLALPGAASASKTQLQMFQDGGQLEANPAAALAKFRAMGANSIRVVVFWYEIAPQPGSKKKPRFNATDPNAYPAANWTSWDAIVRDAAADGIKVDLTLAGGSPTWADGPGIPKAFLHNAHQAWNPNAADYGQFVQAMGKRYTGTFTPKGQSTPLPRVTMWSLWNEPNFGEDLGPQAINDSRILVAPMYYRNLANQGYNALKKTGHSRDTILLGELAVEGYEPGRQPIKTGGLPGVSGQTRPQLFLRQLYCVDNHLKPLTGTAAKSVSCPTTGSASRKFRTQNPGLFNVSGLSIHPYAQNQSPVSKTGDKPDFIHFPDIPKAEALIDRLNKIYGSGKHYSIYNDEYGYITNPPYLNRGSHNYVSPATAAYYINWAEYLSWKNPRIASYMQYLLVDPPPNTGPYAGFASGLYFSDGKPKAELPAYEVPAYMPKTKLSDGQSAEVWGEARASKSMQTDTKQPQPVQIQFQPNGTAAWTTLQTITTSGYFDVHVAIPSSGSLRLSYAYPQTDPFLPLGYPGSAVVSRTIKIT